MLILQARDIGREWVQMHGPQLPGYCGAYFHGSTHYLSAADALPQGSDVDIMVVLDAPERVAKIGKLVYRGVLLEISFLSRELVTDPYSVLSHYHLAGSFRDNGIISDPSGQLRVVQKAVSGEFASLRWVTQRCLNARANIERHLDSVDAHTLLPDRVNSWLFGTAVTTHVLLVAGLRNPTIRRRYVEARNLLTQYGRPEMYEELLELIGAVRLSSEAVAEHLGALEEAFDAACTVVTPEFPFAADISPAGREIAIEGSRTLIAQGDHREAVFWMAATYARCLNVLVSSGLNSSGRFDTGFMRLIGDLGIQSVDDVNRARERVRDYLPRLMQAAHRIAAANPEIIGDARCGNEN